MWTNQQFSADWALNPSAYKDVSHEDVDWASLAQQWIKMKEATTVLIAPPPPPTSTLDKSEEKGEAPMDMETDEKTTEASDPSTWSNWPQWQQSWGWNWSGEGSSEQAPATTSKEAYGYTSTFSPGENSATIDYNHGAGPANQPVYWTGQASGAPDVSTQKDSKPQSRPSRYSWRRSERERDRTKDRFKDRDVKDEETAEDDNADTLDAAKRKQLPLWIREGLEKMEREKQRKIDKEKADMERDEYLRRKKAEDEEALSKMDSVEAAKFMARSKFDSDGSEGEEDKLALIKHRKSRFQEEGRDNTPIPSTAEIKREKAKTPPLTEPTKTREEMLEDLMMNVRRTLTEILLDITTEEIESIAGQVYQKARSKAPAKRLRKSQAFASIAGKSGLGLGIYASDDDSDSDDSNNSPRKATANSDDDLDEVIRQKKENFAKTEAEIEAQLEADEAREKAGRQVIVNTSEDESDGDVGQVERISHDHDVKKEALRSHRIDDNGKRRRKVSETLTETHIDTLTSIEKKNKNKEPSSEGSSSNDSNYSSKKKVLKRKRKRSSSSSNSSSDGKNPRKSDTSDDDRERHKKLTKKKKDGDDSSEENHSKDENETEVERYKRKHKNHDHDKRQRKTKKSDRDDKVKKGSRRSMSRSSEEHRRSRKRSVSRDLERRTRRRSRSKESNHRRRHSRSREEYRKRRSRSLDSGSRRGNSRSREVEYRRNRSRSRDSHRRRRSKSRESNYRRRRSRSKDLDRKHGRRRGRSSS